MPDVEYILRIILRARDEMAAVLAKARTQLRGFAADADKMNLSVDKLNKSMSAFNTNMDGVSKKLESWRAVLRDAGRDSEQAAKSIDNVGKSAQRSATSTQRAAQTQEQLQKAARNLRKEVNDLTKARDNEVVSAKFAASEYERLSKELEKVSLNMSNAARTKTPAQTWALQAKEAADQIKQTDKEITDDAKAQSKQRETNEQEAARRRVAMVKLSNAAIGREIEQQIKDEIAASKNAEQEKARIRADGEKQRVAMVKLANSQIAAEIERQLKDEEAHANREANIKRLTGQRGALNKDVLAGGGRVDREQAKRLAQDFDKLSRSFENGSAEARHWAQEAANVKGVLASLESDTGRAGSAVNKFAHAAEGGAGSAGRMGNSIGALDNQARGLGLLLVIGSMQQLISVAISLGGELVSLASSAAMAGGALGGILAAGAAQALPVFGLLAGAMQRVKAVFDVFQQSQKLQQAQFTDAEKAGQKQIDKTNQLANAVDSQTEAQDRLAESRKALNQANADGVRQLEDLVYQEKAAALAARGASLNVKEAQKALRDAIAGGASSLEIQQRQQSLDEARQGAGRSRVTATRATEDRQAAGGKISGLDSVQNAQKAVKDAERGLVRANRALDQAADKTNRVASATMTAQANLDYLISQLSPAERRLYYAFQTLYNNYRRIFQGTSDKDGIYGVIVDSFTRAVKRVNQIIQQPDVITSIQNLANSIGTAFNKITDSFTDTKTIDQFQQIIGDAGDNLGPLVDMATNLGHAFLNIAETANPAFQNLIKYVGPIVDKFLELTTNKDAMTDFFSTGEKHLESWIDLFLAIGGLFAALIGASAGEGKKSIEDLTKLIDGWTDKLKSNGDKVRDFFKQARQGAFEILGVLEDLAKTLFGSFDPGTISNFADVLHKSVIPALGDVIEGVGKLSNILSKIADNKYGAEFLRYGLAFLFFAQMAVSSLAALRLMRNLVKGVGEQIGHFRDAVKFLRTLPGQLEKVGKSFQTVGKIAEEMGGKYTLVGKAMLGISKIMEAMRVASALMFGPWGLAIALIVIGVVLLLKHFHKLDDVWRGLKAAFQIFLDAIQPALKSLQDALEGMGVHVGSFKDALGVLEAVGKRVADFITVYLVEAFKGLAHVLAGVAIVIIRVFTGLLNIIHGIVDVIIGIFTGDWDQVLNGLEELVKGIVDIMGGVIEGIIQVFEGIVDIFLAPFKAAWEAIKGFFGVHSPSTLAAELGRDIIHGLVAGAKGALRAIGRLAGWIWDKIKNGFEALGGAYRRLWGWVIDKWISILKAEIRGIKNVGEWIWNAIKDSIRAAGHLAKGIVTWLWDKWTGLLKREISGFKNIGTWIYNALSDAIHGIGSKLEDIGSRLIKAIIKGIKAAPKVIHDAIEWLIDKAGPAGGAIRKALNLATPGDNYAEGGPVPGIGSGDTVPAMLTPGEHVLTKAEVQAAGGHAAIFAFRALLGGGSQGGPFGFALGGGVTAADVNVATGAANPQKRKSDLEDQRKDYKRSNDQRALDWHTMWNDMSTTARRAANDIEAQFRDMRDNTSKSAQKMYFSIRGSLADIQKSFATRGKTIVGTWSDNWMSLMKVTHDGLFYIGHETNRALTALGEKHINFGLSEPKKPAADGKAAGGWIGNQGQRGKDRGFYPLGAGEAVLNWAHQSYVEPAMNAYYGHGLGEMFGRVRGFHAGGAGQAGFAGGRAPQFGPIPGMPGEEANTRIIPLLVKLIHQYHAIVTDAYDRDHSAGHKSPGHNVTGTAADMVPGPMTRAGT
jgi:phage-related protein